MSYFKSKRGFQSLFRGLDITKLAHLMSLRQQSKQLKSHSPSCYFIWIPSHMINSLQSPFIIEKLGHYYLSSPKFLYFSPFFNKFLRARNFCLLDHDYFIDTFFVQRLELIIYANVWTHRFSTHSMRGSLKREPRVSSHNQKHNLA